MPFSHPRLCALAIGALAACGTNARPFEGRNNGAVLAGAPLGLGTATGAALRKPLTVEVTGETFGLTVDWAYLVRERADGETAYVIARVTNGGRAGVFFKTDTFELRDADGALVADEPVTFVKGSVAELSREVHTDTALAAGESGYLATISSSVDGAPLYSRVTRLALTWDAPDFGAGSPEARVIPSGYTVDGGELLVSYANEGTAPAAMADGFHQAYLLDDAGLPVFWAFVKYGVMPADPLPAGAGGSAMSSHLDHFEGRASTVEVRLDYADAPENALVSSDPRATDSPLELLEARRLRNERAQALYRR